MVTTGTGTGTGTTAPCIKTPTKNQSGTGTGTGTGTTAAFIKTPTKNQSGTDNAAVFIKTPTKNQCGKKSSSRKDQHHAQSVDTLTKSALEFSKRDSRPTTGCRPPPLHLGRKSPSLRLSLSGVSLMEKVHSSKPSLVSYSMKEVEMAQDARSFYRWFMTPPLLSHDAAFRKRILKIMGVLLCHLLQLQIQLR